MGYKRDSPRRLPEKLLTIRKTLELSQSELAAQIGVTTGGARISEWENGVRAPDLIAVLRYARLASVRMVVLADDDMELVMQRERGKHGSSKGASLVLRLFCF